MMMVLLLMGLNGMTASVVLKRRREEAWYALSESSIALLISSTAVLLSFYRIHPIRSLATKTSNESTRKQNCAMSLALYRLSANIHFSLLYCDMAQSWIRKVREPKHFIFKVVEECMTDQVCHFR
ncbi:hypothetical protein BDB00DRAFT_860073 [Zychaea mexicana]|uniref:uncharacterized protein n=1 Tax=Zychaea mexicana TaxID=64656 RepID=UPI0022FE5A49|nr:uncharacterized protein BDB00DRAFT_860073 [Zychaea mexicana]KAI9474884.1 hypothetical protein BDB00DRAFT_860073 [Zychaea mexicana]